jgi:hypothetical protein
MIPPQTSGVNLSLFADICLYATDRKEGYVLRKIQNGLDYMAAWYTSKFAAECHPLKLQRPQNKVLRTIGNFPRRTSVRNIHKVFHISHVYGYITKSCRQQAEVIQNHENENVHYIGQGEARHRKYKRLTLGGSHVYECSSV